MKIIKINPKNPEKNAIKKAAEILSGGGLVVYPTDTAYGLGANAMDKQAVNKMYEVKGRDFSKPTHVIVKDWSVIEDLTYPNQIARRLYDKLLPGPLTMIVPKRPQVQDILTAGLPTLGIRIPDHLTTRSLSSLLSFPFTTPSANRTGEPAPYSIEEVKKVLDTDKIDLALDAGALPSTPPSTVVDVSTDQIKILRKGPISEREMVQALNAGEAKRR